MHYIRLKESQIVYIFLIFSDLGVSLPEMESEKSAQNVQTLASTLPTSPKKKPFFKKVLIYSIILRQAPSLSPIFPEREVQVYKAFNSKNSATAGI